MFKQIGKLLPGALGRMRVRRPVEAGIVCRASDEALGELFAHAVPMHAIRFKNHTVTVAVVSAGWGQEVRGRQEQLKERINKRLGSNAVVALRTIVDPTQADPGEYPGA